MTEKEFFEKLKEIYIYYKMKESALAIATHSFISDSHSCMVYSESYIVDSVILPFFEKKLEDKKEKSLMKKEIRKQVSMVNEKRYKRHAYNFSTEGLIEKRNFKDMKIKSGRLFPLEEEVYNNFAKKIWEKRNKPYFGKRRVDTIVFGPPETKWKKSWYGGRSIKSIVYRNLGCFIDQHNGKPILNLGIES